MKNCNHDDCFTCPYKDCIGERKAEPKKRGRKPLPPGEAKRRRNARARRYNADHKKEIQEYMKKYYEEHKDEYKARVKKYREMKEIWGA